MGISKGFRCLTEGSNPGYNSLGVLVCLLNLSEHRFFNVICKIQKNIYENRLIQASTIMSNHIYTEWNIFVLIINIMFYVVWGVNQN